MASIIYKTSGTSLTVGLNLEEEIISCKADVSCFITEPDYFIITKNKSISHVLNVTLNELPVTTEYDLLLLLSIATIYRSLGLKEFINQFNFTAKEKKKMLMSDGTFTSISSNLLPRFKAIEELNPDMYANRDKGILRASFIDKKVLELLDSGLDVKILSLS